MKSLLLALLTVVAVVPNVGAQAPAAPPVPHFYALEHGMVEYEITGAVKGKETLYFDQWGMRQARFKTSETTRWGTTNTVSLNLGSNIVFMDPNKNLGQKREDQNLKQILGAHKPDDVGLVSMELLTSLGGKKTMEETFLKRPCEVWETSGPKMKAWVWNGIILKSQVETPEGTVISTALNIDEAIAIDEKVFLIPEQIKFIDHDINQILISQRMKDDSKDYFNQLIARGSLL